MFSNNAVQSSWGQQSQQPPQQGTSAFGQPSTFGSGGGAFGQSQQQPPQANPMFGNLSAPAANPAPSGGFGAFANNTTSTAAANPMFGGAKPAAGFGAFAGGTSSFGGGGGFGSTANNSSGTGLFGQPSNPSGSAFSGGGGGLFGNKPATTGFGSTVANASTTGTTAPVTTGTSSPAFSPFNEKDPSNSNVTLQYHSITAMEPYRGSSYEELRTQDYQQGRKTAGGFGQPAAFGTSAIQPSTSTTGGLFGQPAQPASNSMFGGGTFGANPTPTATTSGFGAFGQNTTSQANTAASGTGAFSAFNPQQQQQPSTGFGAFGQQQQPSTTGNTGTGLFSGTGVFGQNTNQAKPAGAFSAFSNPTGGAFGGSSAFGTNQAQQQPAASGGLFGQPQQSTGAFGTLANNTSKPSIFGQPSQPVTQPTTGFSAFGQPQQNQTQQPAGSIFGQNQPNQQQPNQQSGGLFGNPPATQTAGSGLFGGGGGGGLFGTNNQQTQNQQQPAQSNAFGLFGNKPATPAAPSGGLFGNTFGQTGTNTNLGQQSSIFGNPLGQPANQQSGTGAFGNSLFNKPAAPALGQSQSMAQSGGGLFNSFGNTGSLNLTATAPGAQGTLTASIAQPIGANLPIFSMLPPGPRAVSLDQQPKKKPGFFVDVPTRSPVPRLQLGYTPANTKLRGFASDQLSSSTLFSSGKPNALSLSRTDAKTPSGPDFLGRSSSPSLGSGGRQSVKKLILDKKVEPADLFSKAGPPGSRGNPGKVTFNPAMSQAARERDVARETNGPASPSLSRSHESPAPGTRSFHAPNHFSAHSTSHIIDPKEKDASIVDSQSAELQEGDYWVKPDLDTLRQAGYSQLSSFENLVVGRVGYGEIHFLDPVDLTGLTKLDELRGQVVRFDDKECTVYPDSDDADKPSPGTGLNVRARIILVRCWAVDKGTREAIHDEKHPSAVKHLRRLKNMRDTHFESFDLKEGKWTFTVDHF